MNKRFLYLPIETKVREFDAKLLLAIEALRHDYVVLIGHDIFLRKLDILPSGVVLHKDALNIREPFFKKAQLYGHKVIVLDEEGSIVFDWDSYLTKRVWTGTTDYIDVILCWGKNQYFAIENWKNKVKKNFNLSITGHSRIDIIREPIKQYNKKELISEKIILINTHFALCNFIDSDSVLFKMLKNNKILQTELDLERFNDHVSYKKELMNCYIELLKVISINYPQYKIVLRPHPSENENKWIEITKNLTNVIVTKSHSVGFWIDKAEVVIHTGCTTAIETFLSSKVAIAFKPIKNERFEVKLPDSISIKVENVSECISKIDEVINGILDTEEYFRSGKEILKDDIEISDTKFAYEKIFEEVNKLNTKKHKFNFITLMKIKSSFVKINLKLMLIRIKNMILNRKAVNDKFEKTSEQEVKDILNRLQQSINAEQNIAIKSISKNIFLLTSSSK